MESYIIQNTKTGEIFGKKTYDSRQEAETALAAKKGAKKDLAVRVIGDPQALGLYVQQRIHDDHRPGYYMGIDQIVGYVQEYVNGQQKERKGEAE